MTARGTTKPWKVDYSWPAGPSGTIPHETQDRAELAAQHQRERINPSTGEADCIVSVEYRPARAR